jgi:hypothetical protein
MKACLLIVSLLFTLHSFGQRPAPFMDSLQLWRYSLDTSYHGSQYYSIKPKGEVIFWRIRPVDDTTSWKLRGLVCNPVMAFDVYDIKDTAYCFKRADTIHIISNCQYPNSGGDVIMTGKYVFFNCHPCISCKRFDTGVDYCRPVIEYIFSKVDKKKTTTIQSLVKQFPIAEGEYLYKE